MAKNNKLFSMLGTIRRYWKGEKTHPTLTCFIVSGRDADGNFVNLTIKPEYVKGVKKDADGRVLVTLSFAEMETKYSDPQAHKSDAGTRQALEAMEDDSEIPF